MVIPAALVLPLWIASLAFSVQLARAGNYVRGSLGAARTSAVEAAVAAVAASLVAAAVTLGLAVFSGHWDINLVGLFGFLWLGLATNAWLLLGMIRAVGLGLGAVVGILALFVQQAVSGAMIPASFAPEAVRWAEPIAPLRYIVEGIRNLLIGGSTTGEMVGALAIMAAAGAALLVVGAARLAMAAGRGSATSDRPA